MFHLFKRWLRPDRHDRFTEKHVLCASAAGLHRMAYTEWGDPRNPDVVVCVHGLTRNGRDFDELARAVTRRLAARSHLADRLEQVGQFGLKIG